MNNIGAIDYANSDFTDDNDVCISRRSTEFPRMTPGFKSHFDKNKPWGDYDNP